MTTFHFPGPILNTGMKLKVAHLLRRMERIQRDLEELDHLQKSIREDRDYAGRLRNSLVDESIRLHTLRERLLGQVIHPPQATGAPYWERLMEKDVKSGRRGKSPTISDQSATSSRPAVEITIPPKNALASGESDKKSEKRRQEPGTPAPAGKKGGHAKEPADSAQPPFRFNYDRTSNTER